jgi:SNF2 family DNA or RNA helicase
MLAASGKLVLLDKLLPKLRSEGRRVLIFSQFTMMLALLGEFLDARGFSYVQRDGW